MERSSRCIAYGGVFIAETSLQRRPHMFLRGRNGPQRLSREGPYGRTTIVEKRQQRGDSPGGIAAGTANFEEYGALAGAQGTFKDGLMGGVLRIETLNCQSGGDADRRVRVPEGGREFGKIGSGRVGVTGERTNRLAADFGVRISEQGASRGVRVRATREEHDRNARHDAPPTISRRDLSPPRRRGSRARYTQACQRRLGPIARSHRRRDGTRHRDAHSTGRISRSR